jgi:phosphoglycerate dehydrogenase-like enzyme
MPVLSEEFLVSAPKLKAVFYSAGSIKCFATDAGWDRGIVISSAAAANSVPVAEYSMATILLSLKRFWHFSRYGRPGDGQPEVHVPGACRTKVGLISLGAVGRATAKLLKPFDLTLLAYDPFVSPKLASELQIGLVSLEEIFLKCDVVSLHAPWLPETERMITGQLVASMKEGATLINTSRGALVAEDELAEVLARRPDLTAVLDVTYPEPAAKNSPLRSLPHVVLTPHIAGSMQRECSRMSRGMADELRRYLAGGPLCHPVTREQLALMA